MSGRKWESRGGSRGNRGRQPVRPYHTEGRHQANPQQYGRSFGQRGRGRGSHVQTAPRVRPHPPQPQKLENFNMELDRLNLVSVVADLKSRMETSSPEVVGKLRDQLWFVLDYQKGFETRVDEDIRKEIVADVLRHYSAHKEDSLVPLGESGNPHVIDGVDASSSDSSLEPAKAKVESSATLKKLVHEGDSTHVPSQEFVESSHAQTKALHVSLPKSADSSNIAISGALASVRSPAVIASVCTGATSSRQSEESRAQSEQISRPVFTHGYDNPLSDIYCEPAPVPWPAYLEGQVDMIWKSSEDKPYLIPVLTDRGWSRWIHAGTRPSRGVVNSLGNEGIVSVPTGVLPIARELKVVLQRPQVVLATKFVADLQMEVLGPIMIEGKINPVKNYEVLITSLTWPVNRARDYFLKEMNAPVQSAVATPSDDSDFTAVPRVEPMVEILMPPSTSRYTEHGEGSNDARLKMDSAVSLASSSEGVAAVVMAESVEDESGDIPLNIRVESVVSLASSPPEGMVTVVKAEPTDVPMDFEESGMQESILSTGPVSVEIGPVNVVAASVSTGLTGSIPSAGSVSLEIGSGGVVESALSSSTSLKLPVSSVEIGQASILGAAVDIKPESTLGERKVKKEGPKRSGRSTSCPCGEKGRTVRTHIAEEHAPYYISLTTSCYLCGAATGTAEEALKHLETHLNVGGINMLTWCQWVVGFLIKLAGDLGVNGVPGLVDSLVRRPPPDFRWDPSLVEVTFMQELDKFLGFSPTAYKSGRHANLWTRRTPGVLIYWRVINSLFLRCSSEQQIANHRYRVPVNPHGQLIGVTGTTSPYDVPAGKIPVCDAHCHLQDVYEYTRHHTLTQLKYSDCCRPGDNRYHLSKVVSNLCWPEKWPTGDMLDAMESGEDDGVRVKYAVGIHPKRAHGCLPCLDDWLRKLKWLVVSQKCVAVGEMGLDYSYVHPNSEVAASQRRVFKAQLALAKGCQLPLVLHIRDAPGKQTAWNDALAILEHKVGLDYPLQFHCFKGNQILFEKCMRYTKAYFSISPQLLHPWDPNSRFDPQLERVVTLCPPHRLLIETDSPFLHYSLGRQGPHSKIPNPFWVYRLYEAVAGIWNVSVSTVGWKVMKNMQDLFDC